MLALLALTSCMTNRLIFEGEEFKQYDKLNIKTAIQLERKKHSKDITPNYLIEIGEGIYPNKNKYILATPKSYKIKEKPEFKLETEYFYAVNDNLVKVTLYQWNYLQKKNNDFFVKENYTNKFKAFQVKFDDLTSKLIKEFGEPISISIEQGKIEDETFRDDLKFKRADGLNAYLFMFGNNSNGYRQIRLAIYKD
ncbi:hypothetical protein F1C16_04595 [Hymenobacter sp. NBH84]|uniref:hypothetical protein n=1 Tax=Hymenobacter sp. NBH84 TaxID=2596915 RepID=UPI001629E818|nr:hypothetical protein [Hymenobacter sp. NBH84]QNE38885.1 hypothetical protein F1C16_04595 [Hymenobacter sp. NBH84]